MSYVVPSPLVYQQLANSGGVLNSTPDLDACIIGPVYNILRYVSGDLVSMIKTSATKVTAAIPVTITAGSTTINFAATPAVTVGDILLIPGAGLAGGILQTTVLTVLGLVVTIDTAAITSVTNAAATKKGSLVDTSIINTFNTPNQAPGQIVDTTSIQVYLNNAKVETLSTNFHGFAGSNSLAMVPFTGTATISTGSTTVTLVTQSGKLVVGDYISIVGAGAAGATLVAKVLALPTGSSLTIDTAAGTTATAQAITKNSINTINSISSSPIVEPGDAVTISYTNNASVVSTFNSTVSGVVSATGVLSQISLADVLPTDMSRTTTSTAIAALNATSIVLASVTGLSVGDKIKIASIGGVVGNDFISTVTVINVLTVTFADALTAAAASASVVTFGNQITVHTRKLYNNQLLPAFKISAPASVNYDTSLTATAGTLAIQVSPELVFGVVKSADVFIGYRALRTDLSGSVLEVNTTGDITGILGESTDSNPLALGVLLAKANTVTRVKCIAVPTNDLIGYQAAYDLAQGQRLYALAPLTQDQSILAALKNHVAQMSVPEMANWRTAIVNTAIPTTVNVGTYSSGLMNVNGGNNAIAVSAGKYILTASNATFMSDGVTPGDIVHVFNGATPVGNYTVLSVVSNQQVQLDTTNAIAGISYYVDRALSKSQKAAAIAAVSKSFGLNRVIHVQPDLVGINISGAIKYLPGYYLCAAVAGLIAGFPVQQGFTNIGVAGIADLKNSNFYFTRAQLNTMAESGTFLFMQETQGSIPYCRHELTTDVSVMEYRELLLVKNWDFLSYFYYDKIKSFMGSWNITPDTLNTVRRTIDASSELLKGKKLPKIGPPLLDGKITTLEQSALNKDTVNCVLRISVVYPFNYINLYLTI